MGIGIALGGIAEGFESAEKVQAEQKRLKIAEQEKALLARQIMLRGGALAERFQRGLLSRAEKTIGDELKIVDDVIKAGKAAGRSADKISAAIEPILGDVDALSSAAGLDGSVYRARVDALLTGPTAGESAAATKLDEAKALEAAGVDPQTARESAGIGHRPLNAFDRALLSASGGSPAPAAPATAGGKSFASEAELQAAFKRGEVQVGDTVTVGGQRGTFR